MPEIIISKIAGVFKYPEAKNALNSSPPGTVLIARAEPTNPYDPNAIELFITHPSASMDAGDGVKIETADIKHTKCGYIPKETAARLKGIQDIKVRRGSRFDTIAIEIP